MAFPKTFKPKKNYNLVRFGKENDGGYLINPQVILKAENLVSIGIFDDWSFEKHFIKHNSKAKIYCYDNLISFKFIFIRSLKRLILDLLKLKLKNISKYLYLILDYLIISKKINFTKKIIKKDHIQEILANLKNVLLKVDIEGSEYLVLEDIIKVQKRLNGLIIEFHDVEKNRYIIERFIRKFELELSHIHPNNYGKLDKNNDPNIIELSFERYPEIVDKDIKFPHDLDQRNNLSKPEIIIKFEDQN
tara:strand:- start:163 stop:903 length:741 start_codon:yes stop_codon:yes gene_type:complete